MTEGRVIDLVRSEPNAGLIEELREMLKEAEAGEFSALVAVKMRPNESFAIVKVGRVSDLVLVGALTFAADEVLANNRAHSESK
jgi:hypothetical protein